MASYIINPFCRTSNQPKLNDGRMDKSIGLQSRKLDIVRTLAPPAGEDYTISAIVMVPSLNLPIGFYTYTNNSFTYQRSINHTIASGTNNNANTSITFNDAPANWRFVSQGLRIVPLDSELNQAGYFESVSIPTSRSGGDITTNALNGNAEIRGVAHTGNYLTRLYENIERMRDSQTYKGGNLPTLRKLQFRQLPNDVSHPPINLKNTYAGDFDVNSFYDDMLDMSFQTRIVFIKSGQQRQFALTSIVNLELQYPPQNAITRFETQNESRDISGSIRLLQGPLLIEQAVLAHESVNGVQSSTNSTRGIIPAVLGLARNSETGATRQTAEETLDDEEERHDDRRKRRRVI